MERWGLMKMRSTFLASVALALVGCDDNSAQPNPGDAGPLPIESIPIDECLRPEEDPFPSPACLGPPRSLDGDWSANGFAFEYLVGRWTLCSGRHPTVEVGGLPVVGLEFGADQTWSVLLRDGEGVMASRETHAHGTFGLDRSNSCCQFYDAEGSPVGPGVVEVGCAPHQLVLEQGFYARGPGSGQVQVLAATPEDHPAERCAEEVEPIEMPTEPEAVMALLEGTWRICPSLLSDVFQVDGEDDFGLDLRSNGDWWRLRERDGQLIRGGHIGDVGPWIVFEHDGGPWLELGWFFGVDLETMGGVDGGLISVSLSPRQIRWDRGFQPPVILVGVD